MTSNNGGRRSKHHDDIDDDEGSVFQYSNTEVELKQLVRLMAKHKNQPRLTVLLAMEKDRVNLRDALQFAQGFVDSHVQKRQAKKLKQHQQSVRPDAAPLSLSRRADDHSGDDDEEFKDRRYYKGRSKVARQVTPSKSYSASSSRDSDSSSDDSSSSDEEEDRKMPAKKGTWICGVCTLANSSIRLTCMACASNPPRPSSTIKVKAKRKTIETHQPPQLKPKRKRSPPPSPVASAPVAIRPPPKTMSTVSPPVAVRPRVMKNTTTINTTKNAQKQKRLINKTCSSRNHRKIDQIRREQEEDVTTSEEEEEGDKKMPAKPQWQCEMCTRMNEAMDQNCSLCDACRPEEPRARRNRRKPSQEMETKKKQAELRAQQSAAQEKLIQEMETKKKRARETEDTTRNAGEDRASKTNKKKDATSSSTTVTPSTTASGDSAISTAAIPTAKVSSEEEGSFKDLLEHVQQGLESLRRGDYWADYGLEPTVVLVPAEEEEDDDDDDKWRSDTTSPFRVFFRAVATDMVKQEQGRTGGRLQRIREYMAALQERDEEWVEYIRLHDDPTATNPQWECQVCMTMNEEGNGIDYCTVCTQPKNTPAPATLKTTAANKRNKRRKA
ncbi:expressed unknown protein [Seminavis robusta]|uniref:RanBP2-type domain-containing protein n=1 Tax=Seminavis robusta TaxID=568900 RepID=A0A9N8F424_9STRA|nr:expressed unknown protein [Seminavis robusta]|eukprot:Sro2852_g338610.1 n/a (611) ;mRNA; f:4864-6696